MTGDARISVGLPHHPKTQKLIRRLGDGAGWNLVCLMLWTAQNRHDGDLAGMSDEDIEIAALYHGEPGKFVANLREVRFLDGQEGQYAMHDWAEHNPWACGADLRSAKAKWNAIKRHYGEIEADRQVPDWASIRHANGTAESSAASKTTSKANSTSISNAASTSTATNEQTPSNAPSPSPSPSPSEKLSDTRLDSVSAAIVTAYHEILPSCQRAEVLNPKRRKRLLHVNKLAQNVCKQQGWLYEPEPFWRAFFDECSQDPWMRGEVANPNNPRWKQNIDVLLAEDRFAGVMDAAITSLKSTSPQERSA